MTNPRLRAAAVAGSLALSMSLALAPAAMAQDLSLIHISEPTRQ